MVNHMHENVKIKICGLKRREDIAIVNKYLPDYVGFVFAGTKRCLTREQAGELKSVLSPQIRSVGVFVNESSENIARMCEEGILDLVQLHGDETEEDIRRLKELTDVPVIRAVRVQGSKDILRMADTAADYLLLDAYRANEYGGSGESFCWDYIPAAKGRLKEAGKSMPPFFLAGGLNAGNAPDALKAEPYALDISSGVETDGFKDEQKIKEFVQAVRNAGFQIADSKKHRKGEQTP